MNIGKLLAWSFGLFGILVAALMGVGLVLPSEFEARRETLIVASTEDVHELVGDLAQWDRWTPWKEADPSLVITLGDQTAGVGAWHSWSGENGSGKLVLTKSDPSQGIAFEIQSNRESMKTIGVLDYRKVDGGVMVEWTMKGDLDLPIIGPYFALMIGSSATPLLESGLANLKREAEN